MHKKIVLIIIGIVLLGGGFFGGMKYGQAQNPAGTSFSRRGNFGGANRNGNNLTAGQIIAQDDKSITIQSRDGSSKIVFFSDNTQVSKSVSGSLQDLKTGEQAIVTGMANSDGSISAQAIRLQPAQQM